MQMYLVSLCCVLFLVRLKVWMIVICIPITLGLAIWMLARIKYEILEAYFEYLWV